MHLMSFDPKDDFTEHEPGAVVVSSPSPLKNSYYTMTRNLKTSVEKFNLRDCVLYSCQELNRPEFFLLLQLSLLVFCPSLGLSIIFQYHDIDDEQQQQQEQTDQNMGQSMTQEQTQMTQSMAQTQMQQFVQFIQQLITSMRSDVAQQSMTESQQPQMQLQFAMTKSQSVMIIATQNARSSEDEENENENGEERGNASGEGRQGPIAVRVTTKTWRTVVIHF